MKLLWTVSNWKRTGPVEPSLDLAAAVAGLGHRVQVAWGEAPPGFPNESGACVEARGLEAAETGARLHKHSSPLRDARDVRRMRRWIRSARPDGVVATHRTGHRCLLRAVKRTGTPVVRLWFGDGISEVDERDVAALRASAGVLVFGEAARLQLEALGVPPARIQRTGPPLAVDALRHLVQEPAAVRGVHGIAEHCFVFGIVARMQTHRHFEDLWGAVARLRIEARPFHVLVVGRGTNEETVGRKPVRALGLSSFVTFCGYLQGHAYATTMAAFDAQILLVPGSDATCRALREGMALGVPSIAARRGMLPEIVEDGVSGLLVDEGAEPLAEAMRRMAEAPEAVARLGAQARLRAERLFAAARGAEGFVRLWEALSRARPERILLPCSRYRCRRQSKSGR